MPDTKQGDRHECWPLAACVLLARLESCPRDEIPADGCRTELTKFLNGAMYQSPFREIAAKLTKDLCVDPDASTAPMRRRRTGG